MPRKSDSSDLSSGGYVAGHWATTWTKHKDGVDSAVKEIWIYKQENKKKVLFCSYETELS